MTTLAHIAKALLIAGLAAVAVLATLVVIFLSWLDGLSLDLSGFQFG